MTKSNKKYNELLTDKLNAEDALKEQHKLDIAQLNKEWQAKLADTVAKVRAEEQTKAEGMLKRATDDFNKKQTELRMVIAERDKSIEDLKLQIEQLRKEL